MICQQSSNSSDLPFPSAKAKDTPREHITVPIGTRFHPQVRCCHAQMTADHSTAIFIEEAHRLKLRNGHHEKCALKTVPLFVRLSRARRGLDSVVGMIHAREDVAVHGIVRTSRLYALFRAC